MSLRLIKEEKLNKTVLYSYTHPLEIEKKGVYLIEVTASAKSKLQNFFSGYRADKLNLQIAGKIFDQNASIWNGYLLKGLSKTIVFVLPLRIGCYYLRFIAENKPFLEEIKIYQITDKRIFFKPNINNPAQDGNRRPWYSFIFYNIGLKQFSLTASANKRKSGFFKDDDDDLQLVFNDQRIINKQTNWHKYWYWCGRLLRGTEQTYSQKSDFRPDLNTIELNADRRPLLKRIDLGLDAVKENLPIVKQYKSIAGEDYNRYDEEILKAVDFWNKEFSQQQYTPLELVDPNLVKAIIYIESRIGYYQPPKGYYPAYPDVIQVANDKNPAIHTLNNDGWINPKTGAIARESEFENPQKYKILDYQGKANGGIPEESIKWGVRWLYHKAQKFYGTGPKGELDPPLIREWKTWEQTVIEYNDSERKMQYKEEVWRLYQKGVDPDGKQLW